MPSQYAKPAHMVFIAACGLILASLACNAPTTAQPTPQVANDNGLIAPTPITPQATVPTPEAANDNSVIAPTPTTPSAEPTATVFTPPSAPPPNATGNNISFFYPPSIAKSFTYEVVPPPDTSTGAPVEMMLPSHYRFDLHDYPDFGQYQDPQIFVFPVKNYENFNTVGPVHIAALKDLLDKHPDLSTLLSKAPGQDSLPFLPNYNAAQVFHAQLAYVDFQSGRGIRYITQYDQAPIPINNGELFYTFQGLTNDGKYYVAVTMPITHPSLPTNQEQALKDQAIVDAITKDFEGYLKGVVSTLDSAKVEDFNPTLSLLDQMVNSISVAAE